MSFQSIMLCYYFSLEVVLQGVAKYSPTKKQIDAEIQATLKHASAGKLAEEKIRSLSLQIAKIDLNYKLQLLASEYQKQSPESVLRKRCSYKFLKIHRKAPLPKSLFDKVAGLRLAFLLKKRFWHRCFPMNFAKYLGTLFLQKTSSSCFLDMFLFELSSVISKVSIADFEHVFVRWGRYRITTAIL